MDLHLLTRLCPETLTFCNSHNHQNLSGEGTFTSTESQGYRSIESQWFGCPGNDKLCSNLFSEPHPRLYTYSLLNQKPHSQKSKLLFSFPGDKISRVQFARNLRGKKLNEEIPNLSTGNIPPE